MTVLQTRGESRVLAGRYTLSAPADGGVQLVVGHDEVLGRDVSLLLLPSSVGIRERLSLRLQLRQLSSLQHPHLAHAFDVIDAPGQLGVVLRLLPGARLLTEVGPDLTSPHLVEQIREALQALHAAGRAHGSVSTDAVAVLPDGSAVLLPLPARPGARPEDDVRDLARMAPPLTAAPTKAVPLVEARVSRLPVVEAPTTVLPVVVTRDPTATHILAPVAAPVPATCRVTPVPARTAPQPGARRGRVAVIAAGGFGGALLADLASRLLG